MISVNQVLGDEDMQLALEEALQVVPRLVNDASRLLQGLQRVSDEAERNLVNLRGLTEPLRDQGETIVSKVNRAAGGLDSH